MNQYYIIVNGQQEGPINEDELQTAVSAGKYATGMLIWREGMEGWEPIEQHFQLPTAPPPLPTGTPPPLPGKTEGKTTQNTVQYTYVEAFYSAIKRYLNFKDRASKSECWKALLVYLVVSLLWLPLMCILSFLTIPLMVAGLIYLAIMVMAVSVRRMHDVGKPGWFAWIPIYGLILALRDSQMANKYGKAALKPEILPSTFNRKKSSEK